MTAYYDIYMYTSFFTKGLLNIVCEMLDQEKRMNEAAAAMFTSRALFLGAVIVVFIFKGNKALNYIAICLIICCTTIPIFQLY